jgi:hypothetical protein
MKNTRKRLVDTILDGHTIVTLYSNTKYEWSFTTDAKIDTGADRSSIDIELAKALRLQKVDEVIVVNANGRTRRPVYLLTIEVNNIVYDIECNGVNRFRLNYPLILGMSNLREMCEEE